MLNSLFKYKTKIKDLAVNTVQRPIQYLMIPLSGRSNLVGRPPVRDRTINSIIYLNVSQIYSTVSVSVCIIFIRTIVNENWVAKSFLLSSVSLPYTATKIPLKYSFSGNSAASAPISTFRCLWAIYIVPWSVYIFPPAEYGDQSWEYINRSQTHEYGNWDRDPNIPFLGIFVSKFQYFVFAVYKWGWQNSVRFFLFKI